MSGCFRSANAALIFIASGAFTMAGAFATSEAFGSPAAAAAPAISAAAAASALSACWDHAMTQAQMNHCADADLQSADQALNLVYRQMRGVANDVNDHAPDSAAQKPGGVPNTPDYLQAAQRAWLSYRDKECLSRTNGGPRAPGAGTIAPMEYAMCLTTLTKERVADLQKQSACIRRDADHVENGGSGASPSNTAAIGDNSDGQCAQ